MKIDIPFLVFAGLLGVGTYLLINRVVKSFYATNVLNYPIITTGGEAEPPRPTREELKLPTDYIYTDEGVLVGPRTTMKSFLPADFERPRTEAEKTADAQRLLERDRARSYPQLSPQQIQQEVADWYSKQQLEPGEKLVYDYPGFRRGSDGLMYWDGVTIPTEDMKGELALVQSLPADCNQMASEEGGAARCQWRKENLRIKMERLKRPHWPGSDITAVVGPMISRIQGMRQRELTNCNPSNLARLGMSERMLMERICESRMGTGRRHGRRRVGRGITTTTTSSSSSRRRTDNIIGGGGGPLASILTNINKTILEARRPRPILTAAERAEAASRLVGPDPWQITWLNAVKEYDAYKDSMRAQEEAREGPDNNNNNNYINTGGALYGSSFRRRRNGGF